MRDNTKLALILGVVAAAAVILIVGTLLIVRVFSAWDGDGGSAPFRGPRGFFLDPSSGVYESNGERIYFTGTSATGPAIRADMSGMHSMPSGMMSCASCHGTDGRGGTVRMMMTTFTAPDIRYDNLTSPEHGAEEDEEHDDGNAGHAGHPPYTHETIKRAITEGLDPAGEPLEWMMPRWRMTDEQLNDLIAYLEVLD